MRNAVFLSLALAANPAVSGEAEPEVRNTVYFLSAGASHNLLADVSYSLEKILRFSTRQPEAEKLPRDAYVRRRRAYDADKLLEHFAGKVPEDAVALILVTKYDIRLPEKGPVYSALNAEDRIAVISLRRLRQKFYGLKPDPIQEFGRVEREALYAVGRILGLQECGEASCVMHPAGDLVGLDAKRGGVCETCLKVLEPRLPPKKGKKR